MILITNFDFSNSSRRDFVNSSSLTMLSAIFDVWCESGEISYKYDKICSEILLRFFFDIEGM